MITLRACADRIRLEFASDITFIDYAVDILDDVLSYQGLVDTTNVLVVSRELLKNAVVHGNRNDTGKPVVCRLWRGDADRYRIEIEDQGEGFDGRAALIDRGGGSGRRGYALIRRLAEDVAFNIRGNRVTAVVGGAAAERRSSDNPAGEAV